MGRRAREPAPDWPERARRPRVLFEHPDGAMRWASHRLLEGEGYDVATCAGPSELPHGRCPMAAGEGCALAEGADLVWNATGMTTPETRAVVDALVGQLAETPVVVELSPQRAEMHQDRLSGTWITATPVTGRRFLHQVEAVFRQSGRQR